MKLFELVINWLKRFKRKSKPIMLTPVSDAWIRTHLYDSGKDRNDN